MNKSFYLRSPHGDCGGNVMFWAKCGYSTNVDDARLFTKEEAQEHIDNGRGDLPLLAELVRNKTVLAVDMQYLDEVKAKTYQEGDGLVVIQVNGAYNGNDIKFVGEDGRSTYSWEEAKRFSSMDVNQSGFDNETHTAWPVAYLNTIKRPVFYSTSIDRKQMIIDAGLKLPRPKRKRATTGKTRHNCPNCGKIVWDYNPYEAAYCSTVCEISHSS